MTDPFRHDDAAYVLGALSAEERDVFEAHLLGCAECRSRVAEIADLPRLLTGIDPGDITDAPHDAGPVPDTLLPRLVREARQRRGRAGWLATAAAGVAAGVAVALTLVLAGSPDAAPPASPARAMQALVATPVHADVALTAEDWGTQVTVHCRYFTGAGTSLEYDMTLHDRRGKRYPLGGWRITGGDDITYVAGAPVPENQIKSIDVTTPQGMPVLRLRT
jgi:hypothetical protein